MPVRRCLLLLVISLLALADTPPTSGQVAAPREPFSEVDGSVTIAGKKVEYKATTGWLPVEDQTGKAKASMSFIAYTRKVDGRPASRPFTFCFNGGPGTSSVYVHLGLFGPRRILMNEDGMGAPQPVKLVENEYSLLDLTDLVFIDPVSTGFS